VPEAQLLLADCYLRGRGVTEDYVLAHVWFNCAAAQGIEIAKQYKRLTERCMTPSQIASAQDQSRAMMVA
jgi:TPR repeat protein